ncbi:hypothetical protein FRC12_009223 [Ceratobasidium sp. 428]|nr:hypothetical protein FRC12_009223 [Ceratobasidium sp. 428]
MNYIDDGWNEGTPAPSDASRRRRSASPSLGPLAASQVAGPSSLRHTPTNQEPDRPRPSEARFRVQSRAVLLTWSALREEPTGGLVARYEAWCRSRPNHWATLAVVERHNPDEPGFNPARPLHIHALTISQEHKNGWSTQNARFWDYEGNHPNIIQKGLQDGPGGNPAREAFHYLWKAVGENGEEVGDLMAGELTLEALEGILVEGRRGKRSRQQADLEDGLEIVGAESKEEFYNRYKKLRPLQMTTVWNSVRAYADYTYKTDAGLLPVMAVNLEAPLDRDHIDQADEWFNREVPPKMPGMRHRILVIEGETGTGKTAYARSKGPHSRMCNVWNVGSLSTDADFWILDDMVHTHGKYSLKALSQYEADFTGRYSHVKMMKVRPTVILGNSRSAITKCWSDIEGPEGDAWVEKNVEWVYAGDRPFFVLP